MNTFFNVYDIYRDIYYMSKSNNNSNAISLTYKEPRDEKEFWKKHAVDIAFILLFLFSFIVEFIFINKGRCLIDDSTGEEICSSFINVETHDTQYYVNTIIIIIIPIMDTIITLSITIPDFKISNIEYSEFRRIRGDYGYSLVSMIVISVVLIILCVVSYYLNLFITTIYLNALSIYYLILFSYKEIQVLTKNERYIFKIIRKANDNLTENIADYKKATKLPENYTGETLVNDLNGIAKYRDVYSRRQLLLNQIKLNLLVTYGFVKTYKILWVKQNKYPQDQYDYDLALDLLTTQENFLTNLRRNFDLVEMSGGYYEGYNIYDIISPFYNNLLDIVNNSQDTRLLTKLATDKTVIIGRNISYLEDVMERFNQWDYYSQRFGMLILLMLPNSEHLDDLNVFSLDETQKFNLDNLNYLLVNSLRDHKIWFLKNVNSIFFAATGFSFGKDYLYAHYVYLYAGYVIRYNLVPPEFIDSIRKVMDEKWTPYIHGQEEQYRKNKNIGEKVSLLNGLLNLLNEDKPLFNWSFTPKDNNDPHMPPFDSFYIIFYWLKTFNIHNFNMSDEHTKILKERLNKRNYEKFMRFVKANPSLSFFKNAKEENSTQDTTGLATSGESTNVIEEETDSSEQKNAKSKEEGNVKDISINTMDLVDQQIKKLTFLDDSLNMTDAKTSAGVSLFLGKGQSINQLFNVDSNHNFFVSVLSRPFSKMIDEEINKENSQIKHYDAYTSDIIYEISDSNIVGMALSDNSDLVNKKDSNKKKIINFKKINWLGCAQYDIYCLDGGIKINVQKSFDSHDGTPNDDETESYIKDQCLMENGLYKFTFNNQTQILYSRNAVEQLIKDNFHVVHVSLRYVINIDPSKIIVVSVPKKED